MANIPGATITFQDSFAISGAAASAMQQLPIQIIIDRDHASRLGGQYIPDCFRDADFYRWRYRVKVPGINRVCYYWGVD